MDFKRFFKNKNVIIIIISLIVIFGCIALSRVSQIFIPIAILLSGVLCLFFAYLSYVAYKKDASDVKINDGEENEKQQKKQKRTLMQIKSYGIGQTIVFIIFAITFIIMGINMF